jgi:tripartite-type tricarboxylate transporter receptor subunit TctC
MHKATSGRSTSITTTGLVIAWGCGCLGAPEQAGAYPLKPVRIVVPFAAGGGSETVARALGARLSEVLGQAFLVDLRPGAASLIGTQIVQKAPPDGYTLLLADSGYTIASISYVKPPFDAVADFSAVALVATTPRVLMAHPSFSASLKDLLALPRAQAERIALGTSGGTPQMTYQLLRARTGLTLTEVSYKGGGPALTDAIAGQIPLVFTSLAAGNPFLRTGRLKGLAITTASRHPAAPDIPTFQEAGVADFVMVNWYGLLAPARTPAGVVQTLNREIDRSLRSAETRERLIALGFDIASATPEDFTAMLKGEIEHWKQVLVATRMKLQ